MSCCRSCRISMGLSAATIASRRACSTTPVA
jgi:hypothetical protein